MIDNEVKFIAWRAIACLGFSAVLAGTTYWTGSQWDVFGAGAAFGIGVSFLIVARELAIFERKRDANKNGVRLFKQTP